MRNPVPNNAAKSGSTLRVKEFRLYEELSKCVDSMLFDADTTIASLTAKTDDGIKIVVDLMVRGVASVTYKGVTYHNPSQFPQELRERIMAHPGKWECIGGEADLDDLSDEEMDILAASFDPDDDGLDPELCVSCNNWFEFIYTVTKNGEKIASDGIMCEEDLSKHDPSTLTGSLLAVANEIYKEVA